MYILNLILGVIGFFLLAILVTLPIVLIWWKIKTKKMKKKIPEEVKKKTLEEKEEKLKGGKNGIWKKEKERTNFRGNGRGRNGGRRRERGGGNTSSGLREDKKGKRTDEEGERRDEGTDKNIGDKETSTGRHRIQLPTSSIDEREQSDSKRNWESFE